MVAEFVEISKPDLVGEIFAFIEAKLLDGRQVQNDGAVGVRYLTRDEVPGIEAEQVGIFFRSWLEKAWDFLRFGVDVGR